MWKLARASASSAPEVDIEEGARGVSDEKVEGRQGASSRLSGIRASRDRSRKPPQFERSKNKSSPLHTL